MKSRMKWAANVERLYENFLTKWHIVDHETWIEEEMETALGMVRLHREGHQEDIVGGRGLENGGGVR